MISLSTSWFLKGLSHPAMTPAHIILLLGIGLLIGQQAIAGKLKSHFILSFLFFCLSIFIGFLLNHYLPADIKNSINTEPILLAIALTIGLLTLLKLKLPTLLLLTLVISSGMILGLDSTPAIIPGLHQLSINSWLIGALSGMLGIALLLALTSALLRNILNGMVLRVIASWIATSALFVLTLLLAKH